jgi:alpha-tubulin suppressor-like RCC1 family protein
MNRQQFKFSKDIINNNYFITNVLKIPVLNITQSNPGLLGDIIIDKISNQFCFHNGIQWKCINGFNSGGINIGGQPGQIYSNTIDGVLQFRTLQPDSGIDISTIGDIVSVSNTINGSNIGTGNGLFSTRNGNNLEFKTLVAGQNININDNGSDLTISVNLGQINKIFSNYRNVYYIDVNNKLFGYGINDQYQLGIESADVYLPLLLSNNGILKDKIIVQVAPGNNFGLALDSNGIIYGWGSNNSGQLGNGTNTSSNTPILVDTSGVLSGKTITNVYAGFESGYALDNTGTLYSWGLNTYGKLGNNSLIDSNIPVAVIMPSTTFVKVISTSYVCYALGADGNIYAWGNGINGSLGSISIGSNIPIPVDNTGVLAGKTIVNIGSCNGDSDSSSGYAIDVDGVIYAWGDNTFGQLSDSTNINRSSPIVCGGAIIGNIINKISSHGTGAVYCIDNNGVLYCCGNNNFGQLGINNNINQDIFVQVQTDYKFIDVDGYHFSMIGLTTENPLVACGENSNYQLGVGSPGNKSTLKPVLTAYKVTGPGNSSVINITSDTTLTPILTELSQTYIIIKNIILVDVTITLPDLTLVPNVSLTFIQQSSDISIIQSIPGQTIENKNLIKIGQYDSITLFSSGNGTNWNITKSYMYPVYGFYGSPTYNTIGKKPTRFSFTKFNGQQGNAFDTTLNRLQPKHPGYYNIICSILATFGPYVYIFRIYFEVTTNNGTVTYIPFSSITIESVIHVLTAQYYFTGNEYITIYTEPEVLKDSDVINSPLTYLTYNRGGFY